jgi:hypothetical protein
MVYRLDTFAHYEKYSSKLNLVEFHPRSIEKNLDILLLKLDILRSIIRTFAPMSRKTCQDI